MTDSGDPSKVKVFEVTDNEVGKRLDAYIASHMPEHVSRGRVKDIIKDTGVLVDDKEQKQPNLRVKAGQLPRQPLAVSSAWAVRIVDERPVSEARGLRG